jgi:CBS domain-containing protein
MKVRQVMTPNVEACTRASDLAAAAMIMWRDDCGVVPVVDDDQRVVGVVTDRDICMAAATRHLRPEELSAGEVVSGEVFTVGPDDDVKRALEMMRERKVRRLPVVDSAGRLEGMLSINDLILHAQPGRARATLELSVREVFDTLAAVCAHQVPAVEERAAALAHA